MASKEKAREMQAKDSPEAKAAPNRDPDYCVCFTGKIRLKYLYVQGFES